MERDWEVIWKGFLTRKLTKRKSVLIFEEKPAWWKSSIAGGNQCVYTQGCHDNAGLVVSFQSSLT